MQEITKTQSSTGFMSFVRALSCALATSQVTTSSQEKTTYACTGLSGLAVSSGEVERLMSGVAGASRVVEPTAVSPLIMATKKFAITGLGPATTKDNVQVWLEGFGPVVGVEIVRDGNAAAPIALFEMDIGDEQAFRLTSRISNYWHDGYVVSACLLLH